MTSAFIPVFDLWIAIQKEIGLALLALTEDNGTTHIELNNQFALTDLAINRLLAQQTALKPHLDIIVINKDEHQQKRNDILSRFGKTSSLANWYHDAFERPLLNFLKSIVLHNTKTTGSSKTAILCLMDMIEKLSLARNTAIPLISKNWSDDRSRLIKLLASFQDFVALEKHFFAMADEVQKQVYASQKAASPSNSILCDEIMASMMTDRFLPLLRDIKKIDWFVIFSSKIEMLQATARNCTQDIVASSSSPKTLFFDTLDVEVENLMPSIRSLPLFKNISPITLASLLRTAKIVDANKGDFLIQQGELTTRFLIVLNGWIKIFKGTAEGDEAILQVLGKKEPLLDANFLHDGPCPINARAATKAKLLSIPIKIFREHIAHHKDLVTNMLAVTTHRLQKMTAHFEQVTLKTAEERIGWFLLTLYRETGLEDTPLTLPYDKSLIAAYLNLKPETFSRTLQSFKDKGFKIDKHQIMMPSPRALCDFCDHDIAFRCCNAESDECPRSDLVTPKTGRVPS